VVVAGAARYRMAAVLVAEQNRMVAHIAAHIVVHTGRIVGHMAEAHVVPIASSMWSVSGWRLTELSPATGW
jgi:ABC-type dipeptide/oligopeptide/nickel transport system ATPase subunit